MNSLAELYQLINKGMLMTKYIGTSLSECVRDLLDGEKSTEDVMLIHSNTGVFFFDEFMGELRDYIRNHWGNREQEAKEVLEILWKSGRILQLGLSGDCDYSPTQVKWVAVEMKRNRKRKK